jgi:hypothetical protein
MILVKIKVQKKVSINIRKMITTENLEYQEVLKDIRIPVEIREKVVIMNVEKEEDKMIMKLCYNATLYLIRISNKRYS